MKRIARLGSPLLIIFLFAASLWVIHQELRKNSFQDIVDSWMQLSSHALFSALVLTALSYLILTVYDILACYQIRHLLPFPKVILAAFTGHAISNSVGFALLTGSAIRYRLYSAWGLSAFEIAQVIAFSNLSFWLGIFAVGGVGFLVEPLEIPALLHLPFSSVHPIAWVFLALVAGYISGSFLLKQPLRIRKWEIALPTPWLAFAQLIVASLDWVLAGAVLYVLLPPEINLSFYSFFGIYLLGQIAGIVSHVPGGLGVFETVILLFFASKASAAEILGTLLLYRGIYYFLPLGVALILLGLYELTRQQRRKQRHLRSVGGRK